MKKGKRLLRMEETIRREISELFLREVKDPRLGFCTVTRVRLSADMKYATVYMTFAGREEEGLAGAKSATPFLRREISRRLGLRYSPQLRFIFDEEWENLESLLDTMNALEER